MTFTEAFLNTGWVFAWGVLFFLCSSVIVASFAAILCAKWYFKILAVLLIWVALTFQMMLLKRADRGVTKEQVTIEKN